MEQARVGHHLNQTICHFQERVIADFRSNLHVAVGDCLRTKGGTNPINFTVDGGRDLRTGSVTTQVRIVIRTGRVVR